jgi:SAM-dependent methyltransferase
MHDVRAFYDGLAPLYHLVYEDWDAAIERQGRILADVIRERWGADARLVLDAAVGVGTQALGLAARGFAVTGSDISEGAVRRAVHEATARGLRMACHVADFRALAARDRSADAVIVFDNALPHLETEGDIRRALAECLRCVRPGGGCVISLRDYGAPPPSGTVQVHPYGERRWNGRRYHLRQVWTWQGARYDMALEVQPLDGAEAPTTILNATYFSIAPARVAALMAAVGFTEVARLDGRFFLPLLVGTRPRGT